MKKILLIATGGTIACRRSDRGLVPALCGQELTANLPELEDLCRVSVLDLFRIDSTDMTTEQRMTLAETVWNNMEAFDGVVITHGTDSMAYTAALLYHVLQNLRKPVILTGSQKPMGEEGSDARDNLLGALRTACSHYTGVAVCVWGKIIRGNRAVKTHSTGFDAFGSVNAPLDGRVLKNGDVVLTGMPTPSGVPSFLQELDKNITLLKLTPVTDPALLQFCSRYHAVILEALGAGGIPEHLLTSIRCLTAGGTAVYVITQCPAGLADLSTYAVGRRAVELGAVCLPDMTAEEALAAVMCGKIKSGLQ